MRKREDACDDDVFFFLWLSMPKKRTEKKTRAKSQLAE
jgi:hypothetical protein